MTVDTTGSGSMVPYEEDFSSFGLEDVDASDIAIPRLTIEHKTGQFKDSLSGSIYNSGLEVILLGLVKQRVYWRADTDEGDIPLCKSPNFDHGFPNTDDKLSRDKQFPWNKSNFDTSNAVPIEIAPMGAGKPYPDGWTSNDFPVLPCNSCIFKDWEKTGSDGVPWKNPPCTEQHTWPLLFQAEPGVWQPALYTVQKTGIKPSRTYISSFVQAKQPFFAVKTLLGLTQMKRGSVDYSVPTFARSEATDYNSWLEYKNNYLSIREFVRSAPRRFKEAVGEPSANVNSAPPTVPPSQPAASAPVAAPTAVPAEPATAPVPSAPAAAPAPAAPAAPVSPPPVFPASVTTAPADDDSLPF